MLPDVAEVSRDGAVGQMMDADQLAWPTLADGAPWASGTRVGQFEYKPNGDHFRITFHEAPGEDFAAGRRL